MIGTQKSQYSLLDGVFNGRTKKSRTDALLKKINQFVDWKRFEILCKPMYKPSKKGKPSVPIIAALKCLVVQYLYELSDPALEDSLIDRLSYQRFDGITFDTNIPDYSTIWRFRDRLIKAGLLDKIFSEILKQIDDKGLILGKGTIVDATLVQAARKKHPADSEKPTTPQRDNDATATKRGKKAHFGYKGHIKRLMGFTRVRYVNLARNELHFMFLCMIENIRTGIALHTP